MYQHINYQICLHWQNQIVYRYVTLITKKVQTNGGNKDTHVCPPYVNIDYPWWCLGLLYGTKVWAFLGPVVLFN